MKCCQMLMKKGIVYRDVASCLVINMERVLWTHRLEMIGKMFRRRMNGNMRQPLLSPFFESCFHLVRLCFHDIFDLIVQEKHTQRNNNRKS